MTIELPDATKAAMAVTNRMATDFGMEEFITEGKPGGLFNVAPYPYRAVPVRKRRSHRNDAPQRWYFHRPRTREPEVKNAGAFLFFLQGTEQLLEALPQFAQILGAEAVLGLFDHRDGVGDGSTPEDVMGSAATG